MDWKRFEAVMVYNSVRDVTGENPHCALSWSSILNEVLKMLN